MPPRITLVGTEFYGYIGSIARALKERGALRAVVPYANVRNGWRSIPGKLGSPLLEDAYRKSIIARIRREGVGSDWLLLFRGDLLDPESLDTLREATGARLAIWLIDSVRNMRRGMDLCMKSDIVFCYNRDECALFPAEGPRAVFAPLAFDPALYRPIPQVRRDLDLYTVGNFHPSRMEFLEVLYGKLAPRGLKILGDGRFFSRLRPWRVRRLRRRFPNLMNHASNRAVGHGEINLNTQRAKICLNILPAQATSALNIRAYEICGAGGFQLISRNPVLGDIFAVGREVEDFSDVREAEEKILYHLRDENGQAREQIALRGHRRAMERHTFPKRVEDLLAHLG
jgi:spore maturation protein CgeB